MKITKNFTNVHLLTPELMPRAVSGSVVAILSPLGCTQLSMMSIRETQRYVQQRSASETEAAREAFYSTRSLSPAPLGLDAVYPHADWSVSCGVQKVPRAQVYWAFLCGVHSLRLFSAY